MRDTFLIKTVFDINELHVDIIAFHVDINRRGSVEVESSPRMREIGVRFPVATDLSRKNR